MKLDRNKNNDGSGKYALFLTRRWNEQYSPNGAAEPVTSLQVAVDLLLNEGLLQDPIPGAENEFFVLMLRDRHARPALLAYANSIRATDQEFAAEVDELALRAGPLSPFCKEPETMTVEIDQKAHRVAEFAYRNFNGVHDYPLPPGHLEALLAAITAYLAATTSNAAETAEPVLRDIDYLIDDVVADAYVRGAEGRDTETSPHSAKTLHDAIEKALYLAPQPLSTSSGEDRAAIVEDVEAVRSAFNQAINFALDDCPDGQLEFLRAWREGDTHEWPEFEAAIRKLSEKPE